MPDVPSTMRRRPSARLLVLEETGKVLLFRFVFRQGVLAGRDYWGTPGGALEPGETFEQAAVRELAEETGIRINGVGACVAQRQIVLRLMTGEEVLADEQYFVVKVGQETLSCSGWNHHELEIMTEHKWWSKVELAQTSEEIWPDNLVAVLNGLESCDITGT